MNQDQLEELKIKWYSDINIKFELIRFLKDREFAVIHIVESFKTLRCLKANAIKYLDINFKIYNILTKPLNFYGSLAVFKDYPNFSFDNVKKKKEKDDFNLNYYKYIEKYDYLLDIDNDNNIQKSYETAKKVKEIWDLYEIPYSLKFSGNKGFHFEVSYDDFSDLLKTASFHELANILKSFTEKFARMNDFDDLDLSVYDLRRINKAPYSVVLPSYNIALPLTDEEFENWKIENMHISNQIKKIKNYKKRGRLFRQGKKGAFDKMLSDYLIDDDEDIEDDM